MSAEAARAFVALPLGEELGARVAAEVARVLGPDAARDWKLPRAQGLHLTLFFLGQTPRTELERLSEELRPALAGCAAPRLTLRMTGAFPELKRARVLWIGVQEREAPGRLAEVRRVVLSALARAGVETAAEEARPFHPHVTVARPRTRARVPEAFADLDFELALASDAAVLFESVAAPGGSRYEPLARFPFGRGF